MYWSCGVTISISAQIISQERVVFEDDESNIRVFSSVFQHRNRIEATISVKSSVIIIHIFAKG